MTSEKNINTLGLHYRIDETTGIKLPTNPNFEVSSTNKQGDKWVVYDEVDKLPTEELQEFIRQKAKEFLLDKVFNEEEGKGYYELLQKIKETFEKGVAGGIIEPDYKIKKTKLPRKLKKKYKKEGRICFEVEYRKLPIYEYTIPINVT